MTNTTVHHNYRKTFTLFIAALIMVATALLPASARTQTSARVHPLILQLAAQAPNETIEVIVQKRDKSVDAETVVQQLGGIVTKDLHIINGFAARLTAQAAQRLGTHASINWVSPDAAVQQATVQQAGGPNNAKFTTWTTKIGTVMPNGFSNANNVLSPVGKNGIYGSGGKVKGAFGGFMPEYTPGLSITKLEVALRFYTAKTLGSTESVKVTPYVGGAAVSTITLSPTQLNQVLGAPKASTLYFDISSLRTWRWSDFKTLELLIDQSALSSTSAVFYDALGLRVTANTGTDTSSPLVMSSSTSNTAVDTSVLSNVFNKAVRATDVWNEAPTYLQGSGVTVALIDSGVFQTKNIGRRILGQVNFNSAEHTSTDQYGHGTFLAGILADDGTQSGGKYIGMSPQVNLLSLRVSDDNGMSTESDVVNAMQWVNDNKATYNIRVVNMSLNSSVWQSYNTSPLDAAAEILWFNGIVVVTSAGNNGSATLYPPANDPFVITVGATNDVSTISLSDDSVASFSAFGMDETGRVKPDIVAPGSSIIAYLPDNNNLTISINHPANRVDADYFRMSGTSMSAPIVAGGAVLLLQANPSLTPDQVKYRLKATANKIWPNYNSGTAGAGYLDVYAAVHGTSTESANTGLPVSSMLWTGSTPPVWGSVNWSSVNWSSVNWSSVNWSSVNWSSVNWSSDYWGP